MVRKKWDAHRRQHSANGAKCPVKLCVDFPFESRHFVHTLLEIKHADAFAAHA